MVNLNKIIRNGTPQRQPMRQDPNTGKRYDSHYHNKQPYASGNDTKKPVASEEIKPYVQQSEQQPTTSSSNIQEKLAETKEKISSKGTTYAERNEQSQTWHEEINPMFAEEGFELQRSKSSRIIHRLFQRFRASFSREDEKKLSYALQRNNCRLGLYKGERKMKKARLLILSFVEG